MIATEEQTSQQVTNNSQAPDKLDMNSRKNIMKNMYSQSKRNQGIDLTYRKRQNSHFSEHSKFELFGSILPSQLL